MDLDQLARTTIICQEDRVPDTTAGMSTLRAYVHGTLRRTSAVKNLEHVRHRKMGPYSSVPMRARLLLWSQLAYGFNGRLYAPMLGRLLQADPIFRRCVTSRVAGAMCALATFRAERQCCARRSTQPCYGRVC